ASSSAPRRASTPPIVLSTIPTRPRPAPFPYTTLFRSSPRARVAHRARARRTAAVGARGLVDPPHHGERARPRHAGARVHRGRPRSEEHTSAFQSRFVIVCRLLFEIN